jgi:hypothetical protein
VSPTFESIIEEWRLSAKQLDMRIERDFVFTDSEIDDAAGEYTTGTVSKSNNGKTDTYSLPSGSISRTACSPESI